LMLMCARFKIIFQITHDASSQIKMPDLEKSLANQTPTDQLLLSK